MKKDEQAVQDLILCMDDFDADPFDESVPRFACFNLVLLHHLKYWKIFGVLFNKEKSSLIISSKNECFLKNVFESKDNKKQEIKSCYYTH